MNSYKNLTALSLSAFLLMLGIGMTMALLPQRIIELSNSVSAVGYLASAFAISYVALQIPVGSLADRVGFKALLTTGYILCSLSGLVYHYTQTPGPIFVGRLVQGAGEVPIWALAPAVLSLQYPHAKGKVMGIYNATFHFGLTAGPWLGILIAQFVPQDKVAFLFFAAASLIGGLIVQAFVDNPQRGRSAQSAPPAPSDILALVSSRQRLSVATGIMLFGSGYGLLVTIAPAFLISEQEFDQTSIGLFFSLFYTAISLSQLIIGPLSDRMGRHRFMTCGLALAALGMATFPSLPQPWIMLPLTLASLGLGVFCVCSMAYLNEQALDSQKGTLSGAYYLFWGVGYFLGPLVIGKLGDSIGLKIGFGLFASLLAGAAILVNVTAAKDAQPADA